VGAEPGVWFTSTPYDRWAGRRACVRRERCRAQVKGAYREAEADAEHGWAALDPASSRR
jgi:hypothetical protein